MRNRGFTLIELLVVISIIGLLSSVVLAAVNEGRDKASIRAFQLEMKQVVNALELYKSDNNGEYPDTEETYLLKTVIDNDLSSYIPSNLTYGSNINSLSTNENSVMYLKNPFFGYTLTCPGLDYTKTRYVVAVYDPNYSGDDFGQWTEYNGDTITTDLGVEYYCLAASLD